MVCDRHVLALATVPLNCAVKCEQEFIQASATLSRRIAQRSVMNNSSTTSTSDSQNRTSTEQQNQTQQVAEQLVHLCKNGKGTEAMRTLYADNARHIEPIAKPDCPRVIEGKDALIRKSEQFEKTTTVHSASCGDPLVNGDQFTCDMSMDCTCKEGSMAGKRMRMTETGLYSVVDGKIAEAKFFYDTSTF